MSQVKRKFKEDEKVYVVDYWGTSNGAAAFAVGAIVVSVNEEKENRQTRRLVKDRILAVIGGKSKHTC